VICLVVTDVAQALIPNPFKVPAVSKVTAIVLVEVKAKEVVLKCPKLLASTRKNQLAVFKDVFQFVIIIAIIL
jgi:hypothetical protein